MVTNQTSITSLKELQRKIPELPRLTQFSPLSEATRAILSKFYLTMHGPDAARIQTLIKKNSSELPPPLLISYHPKLSLLNNNVHEALLAVTLASKLGHVPLWIPYLYDTATHSAAEGGKIRAPTYAYFEGRFLTLRAAAKIRGNIIKDEKPVNPKELDAFFREFTDHFTYQLGVLQNNLNQYNFGHALFDLKQRVMKVNRKTVLKELEGLKAEMAVEIKNTRNLGESLGMISRMLLEKLGIPMNIAFIEPLMPDLVKTVFEAILKTPQVRQDPSILEGLFYHYDFQSKTRTPINYTGDTFLAMDDNANRHFEGPLEALTDGLGKGFIIPTGPTLILLFSALGAQITLGGLHTTEYYPEYLDNADRLLTNTDFNHQMQVFCYGGLRHIDTRSCLDILAVSRILEKVGSRTIVNRGELILPDDIVDHLNFLAGPTAVPQEYEPILHNILRQQGSPAENDKTALEKEKIRFDEIDRFNKLPLDGLKAHLTELQPYFRKLKLADLHTERIKMAIEELWEDSKMRVDKMQENIAYEQHLLGGIIRKSAESEECDPSNEDGEDSKGQEIYGGILRRSPRAPTLLEMVLYQSKLDLPFTTPLSVSIADTSHFLYALRPALPENCSSEVETVKITDFITGFRTLIPDNLLPKYFRS
jgi:hypothetical protein